MRDMQRAPLPVCIDGKQPEATTEIQGFEQPTNFFNFFFSFLANLEPCIKYCLAK